MPEVSVVVCAKNEESVIEKCLKSLATQNLKPEIIVVDGHSADNTLKISKRFADKVVEDNKLGISDARNIGARISTGKIIAYCDADCMPENNWTKKISELISGKTVAISGPLVAIDGGFKQRMGFHIWADLIPRFLAVFGYHCLWGANMAFERKILLENPFNVKFLEDYELGSRLRDKKGVLFSKELRMPTSTRRFTKSFHRTSFKYYILGVLKIKIGKADTGYFS